jgi:cystathionine gamma-lyase
MEAWLAHRSLATLSLRLQRQCASAQLLAEFLVAEPTVAAVYYPGLATHPGHAIARRQMQAFGGVVSFDLETAPRGRKFLGGLEIVREATSFGGVHSTAERRARWGGDAISEGFIRFSVGCEAIDDIIDDVTKGLGAAKSRYTELTAFSIKCSHATLLLQRSAQHCSQQVAAGLRSRTSVAHSPSRTQISSSVSR